MKKDEIYLLKKRDAKTILDKDIFKELYPRLKEEDIVIEERSFKLNSKKKLKGKDGVIVRYDWSMSVAPKMYIQFSQHDVSIDDMEKYEALFVLAVRKDDDEIRKIDERMLETIEYKPFYIAQKVYEMQK